ncbi:MAG: HEAT repeat domain-containing protein [Halodesulfurarchaeum sp.]
MTEDAVERARNLLEMARSEPEAIDVEAFDTLLSAEDPQARRYAIDGLQVLAARNPAAVADRADQLTALLTDPEPEVRAGASSAFADRIDPALVAETTDTLAGLLDDQYPIVRWNALEALVRAAREDPGTCQSFVDDIVPFLDADPEEVRLHAARFLAVVASAKPPVVAPAVDRLFDILRTNSDVTVGIEPEMRQHGAVPQSRIDQLTEGVLGRKRDLRQAAGHAIYAVAEERPTVVEQDLETLVTLLEDPDPQVRHVVLAVLFAVGDHYAERIAAHADQIAERIDDDHEGRMVRAAASQTLAAIGTERPAVVASVVVDRAKAIAELLDHDDPAVRASAADLLALVADDDEDAIDPVREALRRRTDDDVEYVRDAAAAALDNE